MYPEHLQDIWGLRDVSTEGRLRFYVISTYIKDVRLHHHDYVEFSYFVKTNGVQRINGVQHALKPGTASFILPHHMHEIQTRPEKDSHKYCCLFDLQLLLGTHDDSEWSRLLYGVGSRLPSFVDFTGEQDERMRRLFEELLHEYRQPGVPGNYQMIRAKLTEMLLLFIRAGSDSRHAQPAVELPRENKKNWFWLVLNYVHIHYAESLTLERVARQFGVSPTHVTRTFREQTGWSFLEYLHYIRIESACVMLLHTNMSITEIGLQVGFESFRSFSRVFREIKGAAPREYRSRTNGSTKG